MQDYEYDSFGNLHDQKNRVKQPYTFTGREWDRETGLYFYRARYYDAEAGRFTSKDPIGIEGGMNQYGYVFNNPVNYRDHSGKYVEVGIRYFYSRLGPFLPFYHCFVRFNGNNADTLSFDTAGTHADPAASRDSTIINILLNVNYIETEPRCDDLDTCVRNEMNSCNNYGFFENNCCDCARSALSRCGLTIRGVWPNFGI